MRFFDVFDGRTWTVWGSQILPGLHWAKAIGDQTFGLKSVSIFTRGLGRCATFTRGYTPAAPSGRRWGYLSGLPFSAP